MTIKEQTLYYILQEQGYSLGATVTAMQILIQSREARRGLSRTGYLVSKWSITSIKSVLSTKAVFSLLKVSNEESPYGMVYLIVIV